MPDQDPNYARIKDLLNTGKASMSQIQGELQKGGYSQAEAEGLIHSAIGVPQGGGGGAPSDTFLEESGLGGLMGLPGAVMHGRPATLGNPLGAFGDILKGMYHGVANETEKEQQASGNSLAQGGVTGIEGAVRHLIGSVPLVGHPIAHGIQNLQQGNLGGLAGDLVSLFGPKLLSEGLDSLGGASRAAGLNAYRSRLPFKTSDLSIEDLQKAVKQGVDKGFPAQNLFASPGQDTLQKIGRMDQPGTYLGDLQKQMDPYVKGVKGQQFGSAQTAYSPFITAVQEHLKAPTTSGSEIAENMLAEAKKGLVDKDPAVMNQVFNTDPAKGPVLTPQQKVNLIDMWAKNNNKTFTVSDLHEGKGRMYDVLSDSAYSEKNAGSAPVGKRDANKLLAVGYKNAVNEVHPEVAPLNELAHNTINLKDALNAAAKESPKEFNILMHMVIGGVGGAATGNFAHMAGPGIMETAGAGVAGAIAVKAAQSPRIATQMGILLGKRFPEVAKAAQPFVQPVGIGGSALGQASQLGNNPIQQLFNPAPNPPPQ